MYAFQMNYKYKPNDIIKTKLNKTYKIIKKAGFNELGLDLHWSEKNYLVEFENKKIILSEKYLNNLNN